MWSSVAQLKTSANVCPECWLQKNLIIKKEPFKHGAILETNVPYKKFIFDIAQCK